MRSALAFLTPVGGARTPDASTLLWFPPVGALVGLGVGAVWVGGQHVWPVLAAAAVALLADALLTGGLHLDGLADTGDGLLPAMPVQRRFDAMSDPRVGAFGAIVVVVVVVVRFAGFASAAASATAIAGLWCASRSAVAVVALTAPYARAQGLASAFVPTGRNVHRAAVVAGTGLLLAVPLVLVARPAAGLTALAMELAVVAAVTAFAARRISGYTGDVLGASIVLGETAGLLTLAARW
jgi:adenosylcobinamide-GDP ribazoletransferase